MKELLDIIDRKRDELATRVPGCVGEFCPDFLGYVVFNEHGAAAVYCAAYGDEGFIGTIVAERVAVNATSLLIIFVVQYKQFIIVVQIALR